jgi:hypothetical protein
MKKQSNITKYLYFGAITLLVMAFGILVLEKSQLINFYNKPLNTIESNTARPVNDIQYAPADPTDNDSINSQKETGSLGNENNPTSESNTPISIILTAFGQDDVGGPLVIRALLNDVKDGTCTLALSKEGAIKSYTANVVNTGTYYSCEGFDIPVSDLGPGTWEISLTVNSGNRTGIAKQTTEVTL